MRNSVTSIAAQLTLLLCAALAIVGCNGSAHEFDRISMPLRFADVRDTAAWCEGFQSAWWKPIDAAYERYDAAVEVIVREQWEPFAIDATLARQQLNPGVTQIAREQWAKHQRIVRALGEAENAFALELLETLPSEADPFIQLLMKRAAFWRATGTWPDAAQRMPGPLEVLALSGRRALDGPTVEAAAVAYANLTLVADAARVRKANAAIAYIDEALALEAAVHVARGGAKDAAQQAFDARKNTYFSNERPRADDVMRLALLREGRAFSAVITDEAARATFVERLVALLHDGMRTSASIKAFARIGARAIAREHPANAALLEDFNREIERVLERQVTLSSGLESGSAADRKRTYEAIVALPNGIVEVLKRALSDDKIWKLAIGTAEIEARLKSEAEVLDATFAPAAAPVADDIAPTELVSGEMGQVRDKGMRTIVGFPLSPRVVRELSGRLALSENDARALDEFRAAETVRAVEASAEALASIKTNFEELGSKKDTADHKVLLRRFMASLRATAARIREIDRTANAALLAFAAQLAHTDAHDGRIELARVEFELLSRIGDDEASNEGESIGGLSGAAVVNPFEIVRRMHAESGTRAAAEDIVFAHADELLAAADEAGAQILVNVEAFLLVLLEGQRAQADRAAGITPKHTKFWRAQFAGADAVELRFRIADELAATLGPEAASAYRAAFRELTAPALVPERPRAFWEIDAIAGGRGLSTAARASTKSMRDSLANALDAADQRREAATLALHEWRARWVRLEALDSPQQWDAVGFASPLAALLRSRIVDADERALAQCAALLDFEGAPADALRALARGKLAVPRAMKPYFP